LPLRHHLLRVHDPLRVQRRLDGPHQIELDLALVMSELLALEAADAVFGADAAVHGGDDAVNRVIELAPARQVLGPVHAYRLGDVVVDVAVADMAERAGTGTGDRLLDHRIRLLDEIGYAGDGNGDIVLDAAAFRYLRLDDRLADPPEVLHLLLALGDHRIQHQAFLDRLGERLLHQLAEATVAPPGTGSHQCVV